MKRRVWKWWRVVVAGIFVLMLAFALPVWASGSAGAPGIGTGSPALRADGGSTGSGGPGDNDDDDDQGGGDGAGDGGQDGHDDSGHDDDGHDDGNGAENGHDDGQNDSGHGAGGGAGYDDSDNDNNDINNNDNDNDNNNDNNNDHEDSSDGQDTAGYARSLGLGEEFVARVAYQARRAGVDKEKLAATLRLMAELVQQGYFPDLGQGADGSVDHDTSGAPSFDELDETTQARLGETLAEVVRTRDHEWIREKLMACARAGMTAIEAIEALASE